ncbi:alpha/beta hydrolase family protein [Chitinophaga nivalis]|uniref:Prolyl oligopeptidase family serine peptidase n=1 Tax=Chitinophaga nivalis TaxID=2991709 RepID=A0ABT3IGI8_9BACT|nr:prolyl oligopeptidase family serine peptidase [Chitinophaga nivalis]MCW3467249.1 prolyl oligopeptidase family serine peptidase [Chitinophaga nivalis]MCW3483059.1 prolyl oligopeptidase family serine peptidase [Chitinophaga nivalis]
MKKKIFFLILQLVTVATIAQKKPLTLTDVESWPLIDLKIISNDGKYIAYSYRIPSGEVKLVIQATQATWKKEIISGDMAAFSQDSRMVIYKTKGDTLYLDKIPDGPKKAIPGVFNFNAISIDKEEYLLYQLNDSLKRCVIQKITSGQQEEIIGVNQYLISPDQKTILFYTSTKKEKYTAHALYWYKLSDNSRQQIWMDSLSVLSFCFDPTGKQVAFQTASNNIQQATTQIRYFKEGMSSAKVLLNDHSPEIDPSYILDNGFDVPFFSSNGAHLYFYQKKKADTTLTLTNVAVDIWHYQDTRLQSQQLEATNFAPKTYLSAFSFATGHIVPITTNEYEYTQQPAIRSKGDYVLMSILKGDPGEKNWNVQGRESVFLISLLTGEKKLIKQNISNYSLNDYQLSPNGKYLVYYDCDSMHYFSYNTTTGDRINISGNIKVPFYDETNDYPYLPASNGIAAFTTDESGVFVYDNYDIWLLSLKSRTANNTCITNHYGRMNHTVLRIMDPFSKMGNINTRQKLIVTAFNTRNKYNGFYQIDFNHPSKSRILTIGPYLYYYPFNSYKIYPDTLIKSKHPTAYLLVRMSDREAPNLFFTTHFKTFSPLTNFAPQESVNWLRKELFHWKMPDNTTGTAILYKPADFDPQKKYPVLFYLYEKNSNELYFFDRPLPSNGALNVSYFVSNGYVVCSPDITYKTGSPGQSSFDAVTSCAQQLAAMLWVDSSKMGLQGISFGGYEVNYLISHTSLFAAAAECAGVTDFVSGYNSIRSGGISQQYLYETFQNRMGKTLWEDKTGYISNSPIFAADKVNTPLLIMHNKGDRQVLLEQGISWFLALRRLQKKVWLLQYDGEYHGLLQYDNQMDYSIRMAQFFDHFLKGKPAPLWMQKGIPAIMKLKQSGL